MRWWAVPLAALVVATWSVSVNRLLVDVAHIDRLTVVNPTAYDIGVEVTDGDRDGWLTLGDAHDRTATSFEEVLDQGKVWILRFAEGEASELRLTREELERADWRVELPVETESRLRPRWGPPERLAD
jgi:hypothetical protein